MASPEVATLTRRFDEQDDTVRAISDTVLDIKETVDQHTESLATMRESLVGVQQDQVSMQQTLTQHGELLVEILHRLGGGASGGPAH